MSIHNNLNTLYSTYHLEHTKTTSCWFTVQLSYPIVINHFPERSRHIHDTIQKLSLVILLHKLILFIFYNKQYPSALILLDIQYRPAILRSNNWPTSKLRL